MPGRWAVYSGGEVACPSGRRCRSRKSVWFIATLGSNPSATATRGGFGSPSPPLLCAPRAPLCPCVPPLHPTVPPRPKPRFPAPHCAPAAQAEIPCTPLPPAIQAPRPTSSMLVWAKEVGLGKASYPQSDFLSPNIAAFHAPLLHYVLLLHFAPVAAFDVPLLALCRSNRTANTATGAKPSNRTHNAATLREAVGGVMGRGSQDGR